VPTSGRTSLGQEKISFSALRGMTDVMSDKMLAYLVSVVIIMTGAIWIVASGHSAASALYIAIGIPTIVVGLASLFGEWRN
jgi:hypothetical protein